MQVERILNKYSDSISKKEDIFAEKKPSFFFRVLGKRFLYLLSNDANKTISRKGIRRRQKINPLFKKLGKLFLTNKQVFENRKSLVDKNNDEADDGIELMDRPIIWVSNHAFKDDALATLLAMKRNGYILFGSLPTFYQSMDGLTAWINGVIMMNRKVKESRLSAQEKMVAALSSGADLLMYPEGVWNKTPHQLMLDIYPGIYRMAKKTGAQIVPIIHYFNDVADKSDENMIHTVIDNPLTVDGMEEKEFCTKLRDLMCTWLWRMMEKYGKSTREETLKGFKDSKSAWEKELADRVGEVDGYDLEIELSADYRPKNKVRMHDVYYPMSEVESISIDNAEFVAKAISIVKREKNNDCQRRF